MWQKTSIVTSNLYVCCNHLIIPVSCQLWLGRGESQERSTGCTSVDLWKCQLEPENPQFVFGRGNTVPSGWHPTQALVAPLESSTCTQDNHLPHSFLNLTPMSPGTISQNKLKVATVLTGWFQISLTQIVTPLFFPKPDSYLSRDFTKQAQSGYGVNRLILDLLNTDSNSSLLS